MRFLVVAVGKPRDAALHAAITEYETRAARYWPLAAHAVREEPARSATAAQVREREGERLMDKLPPGCRVVCCDPAGDAMSSEQFAQWLVEAREAARDLAFVIGGAFGLSSDLLQRSERRLLLAGVGAVVGVGKEIRDLGRENASASVKDIVWDLAGVGAAAAVQSRAQ